MTSIESESRVPSERTLRVLIVEDNPRDAELTVATLKRAGLPFTYRVVDSPQEFQQELEQVEHDVIISDYNLRTWNAMDALEGLRCFRKDIPFILVTGTLGDEAAVECIKQGATDYVLKDHMVRLPSVVTRALADKALRDERRRAEEKLVKLRQAVDASGEVVFMTDRAGIITFINPEFTRLYGYEEAEVVGKVTPRILKSSMQPEDSANFWSAILDKRVWRGDFINRSKDGRLVSIQSSANPILDEGGNLTGFLAIQRDITEQKLLEEQFQQSQKMEAVGQLAGGIAHDFNNLLTVISGFSMLLLESLGNDAPSRKHAEEIRMASERAALLTRQLLAFSRRQILLPEVLDLNAVVGEADSMLRHLIGEDIELQTQRCHDLGRVKADRGQIHQILMNLAVNARDAMPRGGRLTLETANVELDNAYAHDHMEVKPGRYVMLALSDTGTGMDAQTQSRIFEPFFTTKEKGKGTGLGLAMVYGIVKQSGGNIWVYSEPGHGTTFKIYLPRVDEIVPAAKPMAPSAALPAASETILLVEDEPGVRSLVRRVLESRGYTVLEASRGEEALQVSAAHPGPIHLLLTDVIMPGMTGPELADRLGPRYPDMKVSFMSGYTDEAIVHHGVLDSGTSFLQKPFTPDALTRKVREILGLNGAG